MGESSNLVRRNSGTSPSLTGIIVVICVVAAMFVTGCVAYYLKRRSVRKHNEDSGGARGAEPSIESQWRSRKEVEDRQRQRSAGGGSSEGGIDYQGVQKLPYAKGRQADRFARLAKVRDLSVFFCVEWDPS
jgi:hypothetical protein